MTHEVIIDKWVSFYELRHVNVDIEVEPTNSPTIPFFKITKFNYNNKNYTEEEIDNVLWNLGLNTKQYRYVIEEPASHRTSKHGVKYDYRFVCPERRDKEWLEKGNPSEEVKMASCKMKDMSTVAYHLKSGNMKNY